MCLTTGRKRPKKKDVYSVIDGTKHGLRKVSTDGWGKREINTSASRMANCGGKKQILAGIQKGIDMLFLDKNALLPLSVEQSKVPRNRMVPSRMILVENLTTRSRPVWSRLRSRRVDQDPELLSLVRNNQTSAPTVPMAGKVTTLQEIASWGADVELGDVTDALLESAELQRDAEKLYLQQPKGSLPGLSDQQWLEVVLPLYGLKDSPKR